MALETLTINYESDALAEQVARIAPVVGQTATAFELMATEQTDSQPMNATASWDTKIGDSSVTIRDGDDAW